MVWSLNCECAAALYDITKGGGVGVTGQRAALTYKTEMQSVGGNLRNVFLCLMVFIILNYIEFL